MNIRHVMQSEFSKPSGIGWGLAVCIAASIIVHGNPFSNADTAWKVVGGASPPLLIGLLIGLFLGRTATPESKTYIRNGSVFFTGVVFMVLVFFGEQAGANGGMTGTARREFIDGFKQSCYATQSNASVNHGVPSSTIQEYCRCSANYVADRLAKKYAKSIANRENTFPPSLTTEAGAYCANQIQ